MTNYHRERAKFLAEVITYLYFKSDGKKILSEKYGFAEKIISWFIYKYDIQEYLSELLSDEISEYLEEEEQEIGE